MAHDFKVLRVPVTILVSVCLFVLAACTSAGPTAGRSAEEGLGEARTVDHAFGEVDVPTHPQSVIALDELAGINALLSGIKPRIVYASLGDTVSADLIRDSGVEVKDVEVLSVPDREELLTYKPDLLVGTGAESPAGASYDAISEVAPTAIIDIKGDWREIALGAADVFSAKEAGERQVEAVEEKISAAAELTEDESPELAYFGYSTEPFTLPASTPSSVLIKEAGFSRPESEQIENDSYSAPFSLEVLDNHEAQLMVIPDGPGYPATKITEVDAFERMEGTAVHPVAQQWLGNTAFSFWVIAADLETLAAEDDEVITEEEIPNQWADFLSEVDQ